MSETVYEASDWGNEYHSLTTHEALGAGAAGPGKSWVLLTDPLQQIYVEHERCKNKRHKHYHGWGQSVGWALHLRRTRPMLELTIRRSHLIFPQLGGKYESQKTMWTFQSGYRYQFGHCMNPDDWENYMSNEYCMAKGQRIVMGDGSKKAIEKIRVGDHVMTLEGPRKVTHAFETGLKPVVDVRVRYRGEIIGTQRHPTTHPVLLWPTSESSLTPSPDSQSNAQRSPSPAFLWQDYESLLCGRPNSPVKRVSLIGREIGCKESADARLAALRLPTLSVPVVLHAPTAQKAFSSLESAAREYRSSGLQRESCLCSAQDGMPLLSGSFPSLSNTSHPSPTLDYGTSRYAYDDAYGLLGSGIPSGYRAGCFAYPYLHGELSPQGKVYVQGHAPPPIYAGKHSPICWGNYDLVETPQHNPCSPSLYPHFYTAENRSLTEECHRGLAHISFAGWEQTYDLTVEDANHYISESALVNVQSWIGFDELVQFEEEQYEQISGRCRSSDEVLRTMLKVRSMSNPMQRREYNFNVALKDPQWVRRRFVDPAPQGRIVLKKKIKRKDGTEDWRTRIYLPATLYDNPDKQFVKDYESTLLDKPAHIQQALLYGNWYVTAGAFYGDDWNDELHIRTPFKLPDSWPRFRSMDWGFKSPGTVLWWGMDEDGNIYCEKEFSFKGMTDVEVAERIKGIEKELGLWRGKKSAISGPADPQLWEQRGDTGRSKAENMAAHGVNWVPAHRSPGSRATNAQRFLARLRDHRHGTTTPGIVFFNNCIMCRRTIPGIQTSSNDAECPADGGDDHWHDAVLYACAYASHGRGGIAQRVKRDEFDDEREYERQKRGQLGYGLML